jgi:glutamate/tyrosine decarboxylase-like PLP-dependent enzyme
MQSPLELPADEREALGRAALDWVLKYFDRAATPPLYPVVSADTLRELLTESLPKAGKDPARVLEQFAQLAALGRNNGHPRMFGYVQSSGNFAGTVGDFLASALNQNVTSWRSAPSATTLERQVIDWMKEFVGLDARAAGVLVAGGSAANAAALTAALHASTAVDLVSRGVAALPSRPRIYASDRVHMSIPKAASLIGLGRDAVRTIETRSDGTMDTTALARVIADDRTAGVHQVCVVANAGEVNAGAIDPLAEIADICSANSLWLHVDGAYGGFAAAVPSLAAAFAGISRADSLSLDPHKWLFAPVDAGCLLVRDERHLRRAFSHGASYIDVVADRDMSDFAFWDVSPELSRRFRALKIWFALKCHGAAAFVATIERNVDIARQLGAAIDASDDFERLAAVPLSIVCFRYAPTQIRGDEHALNSVNRRLMVEVQRAGQSYVSNAMLGNTFALRACIVNHRTSEDDVPALLDDIRRVAAGLEPG